MPDPSKCICGLRLFNSKDEAEAAGVPFDERVNLNTNGRCFDCARRGPDYPVKAKAAKENPMSKTRITDQQVADVYHDYYIGKSASADFCAGLLDYAASVSFINRCQKLGLRTRTRPESLRAISGQPWEWEGGESLTLPPAEITLSQNGNSQDTAVDKMTNLVRELLELGQDWRGQLSISLTIDVNPPNKEAHVPQEGRVPQGEVCE